MLEVAVAQLRHAMATIWGHEPRTADLAVLLRGMRASTAEFGPAAAAAVDDALGAPPDEAMRTEVRNKGIRRATRQAHGTTTFYRELVDAHGGPDVVGTFEGFGELPVTRKADLRARPGDFINRDANPMLRSSTTGTSGAPTPCWFTAKEIDHAVLYSAIAYLSGSGLGRQHLVHIGINGQSTLATHTAIGALREAGLAHQHLGVVDPELALHQMAAAQAESGLPVGALIACPSYLAELVDAASVVGLPPVLRLERIFAGGEILTETLRQQISQTFGGVVREAYSMTEAFPMTAQNCGQGHLHFSSTTGLAEVVDPVTGAHVGPGEAGLLTLTPFPPYRVGTPVLRLMTDDVVHTVEGNLRCSLRALPATSLVLGKGEDLTRPRSRDILGSLHRAMPRLSVRYGLTVEGGSWLLHVDRQTIADLELEHVHQSLLADLPMLAGVRFHERDGALPGEVSRRSDAKSGLCSDQLTAGAGVLR